MGSNSGTGFLFGVWEMFGEWRYPFDLVLTDVNGWQRMVGRAWRVSTSVSGSVRHSPCLARSRHALPSPYMIFFLSLVLYSPFIPFFEHFVFPFFPVQSIFYFPPLSSSHLGFPVARSGQPSHDKRVRTFSLGKRVGRFHLLHSWGLFIFIWVPVF